MVDDKKTGSLTVPKHAFPFGKGFWVIRANHRALHELENRGGARRPFGVVLASGDGSQSFYYDLLWAMSATHRHQAEPGVTFEEWLEELPTGDDWQSLVDKAYELLAEAMPRKKPEPEVGPEDDDEDDEGKSQPAPSEPETPPTSPGSTEYT